MHFSPVLPQIDGVTLVKQGKVRDVYKVDGNYLLVATDRISAFDFILPSEILGKGQLLTQISNFWFNLFADEMDNHIIETKFDHFPEVLKPYKKELYGRSVLVRQTEVIPFECVARGYLVGSGYKDYQANGSVCGHELSKNIELAAKLDPALFTPATKAEMGDHDENVSIEYMANKLGDELTVKLETKTLDLYSKARDYAAQRGIILADTKLEFGLVGDKVLLIDEIFTPDSSRFWPVDQYAVGANPPSMDKQFVRDYLANCGWDKVSAPPALPQEVLDGTLERYNGILQQLSGRTLEETLELFA